MTEREAIEALKMLKRTVKEESDSDKAIDLAISALEKQEQDRWIPVTERLPEKERCYLVAVKNDHERRYSKTAWFCQGAWSMARQKVLAWRFLPEPFKEEEDQ